MSYRVKHPKDAQSSGDSNWHTPGDSNLHTPGLPGPLRENSYSPIVAFPPLERLLDYFVPNGCNPSIYEEQPNGPAEMFNIAKKNCGYDASEPEGGSVKGLVATTAFMFGVSRWVRGPVRINDSGNSGRTGGAGRKPVSTENQQPHRGNNGRGDPETSQSTPENWQPTSEAKTAVMKRALWAEEEIGTMGFKVAEQPAVGGGIVSELKNASGEVLASLRFFETSYAVGPLQRAQGITPERLRAGALLVLLEARGGGLGRASKPDPSTSPPIRAQHASPAQMASLKADIAELNQTLVLRQIARSLSGAHQLHDVLLPVSANFVRHGGGGVGFFMRIENGVLKARTSGVFNNEYFVPVDNMTRAVVGLKNLVNRTFSTP